MNSMDLATGPLEDTATTDAAPDVSSRAILDSLLDPHFLLKPRRDASGKITDFTIVEANTAAAQPVSTPAGPVTATLSIGVTLARPDETTDTLVARADSAMYRAKHSGRNRIVPFEGEASPLTP